MQKHDLPLRAAAVAVLGSLTLALPAPPQESAPDEVDEIAELAEAVTAALEAKAEEAVAPQPANAVAPAEIRSTEKAKKRKKRKRRAIEGTLPIEWVDEFHWRSIGPANMGGRCIDIAVHPTDPTCFWIATASGGLLKTTNNGVDYEHQFGGEATVSIGSVAVSQSNPDVIWVGTGEANPRNSVSWGDGVYKSVDGGDTWEHMGLEESFQVGAVIIHPTDPDIVYIGALGHLWGPNEERGLYKTTDGGGSWTRILYLDDETGVIDARMHPEDPETLLVATYVRRRDAFDTNDPWRKWGGGGAIYKTTDGGASFRKLTNGLPTVKLGRVGLDYCTSDPNVVYAVIETERISQEPENAAYAGFRGEDAEVGARLTRITEEGPAEEAGLKDGDIVITMDGTLINTYRDLTKLIRKHVEGETVHFVVSREKKTVEMDLTFTRRPSQEEDKEPSEAQKKRAEKKAEKEAAEKAAKKGPLEVAKPEFPSPGPFSGGLGGQRENVQDDQGAEGFQYGGVYRSADGGENWERINSVNPRPMYYSQIRVDPSDANHVYVLGTSLYRSSDGGETFTGDGGGRDVHVDHHALWIDPSDGRHMILGNDGGIYVTWDRMESWDHHNHVAIGQFYDITADNTRDYMVYGGLQDNGSWGGPNRSSSRAGTNNSDWLSIGGGDGFICWVDDDDPDLIYYESQNGGMGRTHLATGEGGYMRPRGERGVRYRFCWKTPFLLSNHNAKIFYSAGNYVFRSLDRGQGMRRISDEITLTDRGAATSLAESPRNEDELYVGTDDGALWMTSNGGVEWRDLFALNAPEAELPEAKPATVAVVESGVAPVLGQGAAIEPSGDAITGEWDAIAEGDDMQNDEEGEFTLSLRLGADGKVTGLVQSQMGEGEIKDGKYDPETGKLHFSSTSDDFVVRFEGTVKDDEMTGSIIGPAGSFHYGFTARRTSAPESDPDPAEGGVSADFNSEIAAAVVEVLVDAAIVAAPEEEFEEPTEERPRGKKDDEESGEKKFIEDTIDQLLPGRYRVSSLVASRHGDGRVYATFDGHYLDDTEPHVFVSEDRGTTWKSIRGNLPDYVGSVRVLVEDEGNEDLLFLGTEFSAFVSIDRGESWTRFHGNLPTVAIHDFEVQMASGELIAGTHGRSIWITDITALRQMSAEKVGADAELYDPNDVILWRRGKSRGSVGTRSFSGEGPSSSVEIFYSLGKKARDLELSVTKPDGTVVKVLEASGDKGLHRVSWDMRTTRTDSRGRRRGGRRASPGTYVAVLRVGEQIQKHEFEVRIDLSAPDARYLEFERLNEELEEQRRADETEELEFDDL